MMRMMIRMKTIMVILEKMPIVITSFFSYMLESRSTSNSGVIHMDMKISNIKYLTNIAFSVTVPVVHI